MALSAGRYEVVATSYDLLRGCIDRLKKQRFDAVLFDEYHTIKSARYDDASEAVKSLHSFAASIERYVRASTRKRNAVFWLAEKGPRRSTAAS